MSPINKIITYSIAYGLILFLGTGFFMKMAHANWDKFLVVFMGWFTKGFIWTAVWIAIAAALKLKGNVLIFVPFLHLVLLLMIGRDNYDTNYLFIGLYFSVSFAYSLLVIPEIYKMQERKRADDETLDSQN
jgi:hypothetical protein